MTGSLLHSTTYYMSWFDYAHMILEFSAAAWKQRNVPNSVLPEMQILHRGRRQIPRLDCTWFLWHNAGGACWRTRVVYDKLDLAARIVKLARREKPSR